jgi:hypothetical protein
MDNNRLQAPHRIFLLVHGLLPPPPPPPHTPRCHHRFLMIASQIYLKYMRMMQSKQRFSCMSARAAVCDTILDLTPSFALLL